MRILLDTNALIRVRQGWSGFHPTTKGLLADLSNTVLVSSISAMEISVKVSIGKLAPLPQGLTKTMTAMHWTELPFAVRHAEFMLNLPWHHKDPFDRMIIAQALVEDLPVVTSDRRFSEYGVEVL